MMQPLAGQYDFTKTHPKIGAYIERVKDKTDPHFTEAHRRINHIKQRVAEGVTGPDVLPTDPSIL